MKKVAFELFILGCKGFAVFVATKIANDLTKK